MSHTFPVNEEEGALVKMQLFRGAICGGELAK